MRDDWLDLVLGSACVGCGRPGRLVCPDCDAALPTGAVRVSPDPRPPGLAPCHAAAEYADPVRRMILLHKERHVFGLVGPLGRLLAGAVRNGMHTGARTVLVPVPSRPAVVRARGHDPLLRLTREAAGVVRAGPGDSPPDVTVLALLRQREPVADQAGLDAVQRSANLSGRFGVRGGALRALARARVPVAAIVCDDVLTTGSTAREAQRALEAVGVPVAAICCVAATRRRAPLPK